MSTSATEPSHSPTSVPPETPLQPAIGSSVFTPLTPTLPFTAISWATSPPPTATTATFSFAPATQPLTISKGPTSASKPKGPLFLQPKSLFNDPNADVILRSSDFVDFRVYKLVLSLASPFFKDMFSMSRRDKQSEENSVIKDELEIVTLSEESHTLHALLNLCYPKWTPAVRIRSLDEMKAVMEAAEKYGMREVQLCAGKELLAHSWSEPDWLRVFAVACRFKLESVARVAAKGTLGLPPLGRPYFSEFEHITAASLHRVQEYHFRCVRATQQITKNHRIWGTTLFDVSLGQRFVWFECIHCSKGEIIPSAPGRTQGPQPVASWWIEYIKGVESAFQDRPRSVSAIDSRLIEKTLGKTRNCPVCGIRATHDLTVFSQKLAAEVDIAISKVPFQLGF